jgi:folate-dependent phosphoribosylglycinamide formyltransferase PurN
VRRCISWTLSTTPGRLCVRSASGSFPGDTVESLKARVQACEREAVVKTLAAMASGELPFGKARPDCSTLGVL